MIFSISLIIAFVVRPFAAYAAQGGMPQPPSISRPLSEPAPIQLNPIERLGRQGVDVNIMREDLKKLIEEDLAGKKLKTILKKNLEEENKRIVPDAHLQLYNDSPLSIGTFVKIHNINRNSAAFEPLIAKIKLDGFDSSMQNDLEEAFRNSQLADNNPNLSPQQKARVKGEFEQVIADAKEKGEYFLAQLYGFDLITRQTLAKWYSEVANDPARLKDLFRTVPDEDIFFREHGAIITALVGLGEDWAIVLQKFPEGEVRLGYVRNISYHPQPLTAIIATPQLVPVVDAPSQRALDEEIIAYLTKVAKHNGVKGVIIGPDFVMRDDQGRIVNPSEYKNSLGWGGAYALILSRIKYLEDRAGMRGTGVASNQVARLRRILNNVADNWHKAYQVQMILDTDQFNDPEVVYNQEQRDGVLRLIYGLNNGLAFTQSQVAEMMDIAPGTVQHYVDQTKAFIKKIESEASVQNLSFDEYIIRGKVVIKKLSQELSQKTELIFAHVDIFYADNSNPYLHEDSLLLLNYLATNKGFKDGANYSDLAKNAPLRADGVLVTAGQLRELARRFNDLVREHDALLDERYGGHGVVEYNRFIADELARRKQAYEDADRAINSLEKQYENKSARDNMLWDPLRSKIAHIIFADGNSVITALKIQEIEKATGESFNYDSKRARLYNIKARVEGEMKRAAEEKLKPVTIDDSTKDLLRMMQFDLADVYDKYGGHNSRIRTKSGKLEPWPDSIPTLEDITLEKDPDTKKQLQQEQEDLLKLYTPEDYDRLVKMRDSKIQALADIYVKYNKKGLFDDLKNRYGIEITFNALHQAGPMSDFLLKKNEEAAWLRDYIKSDFPQDIRSKK